MANNNEVEKGKSVWGHCFMCDHKKLYTYLLLSRIWKWKR